MDGNRTISDTAVRLLQYEVVSGCMSGKTCTHRIVLNIQSLPKDQWNEEEADFKDNTNQQTNRKHDMNSDNMLFEVTLSNLNGVDPLSIQLPKDASFAELNQTINQILKLDDDTAVELIKPTHLESVPPAFPIKVGSADIIDFEKEIFEISKDTRFIQYGNDFLDKARLYDDESKNDDQTDGEIKFDGNLSAKLEEKTLMIGDARIQFQQTVNIHFMIHTQLCSADIIGNVLCQITQLRIPDDNNEYPLPPSFGEFPC